VLALIHSVLCDCAASPRHPLLRLSAAMSYQVPYDQHRANNNTAQYAEPVKGQGPQPGAGTAAAQGLQTRAPYQDKWSAIQQDEMERCTEYLGRYATGATLGVDAGR